MATQWRIEMSRDIDIVNELYLIYRIWQVIFMYHLNDKATHAYVSDVGVRKLSNWYGTLRNRCDPRPIIERSLQLNHKTEFLAILEDNEDMIIYVRVYQKHAYRVYSFEELLDKQHAFSMIIYTFNASANCA
jgi:hypothetical protein